MTGARAMVAGLAIAVAACGDDGGELGVVDAGRSLDSAPTRCADSADCAGEPFANLCSMQQCVECASGADCGDPGDLGPDCDVAAGLCICEGDTDCAGNGNGPVCNQIVRACSCVSDRDCPDPQRCELEPYLGSGVRTCQPR